jgi:hypothetical protein
MYENITHCMHFDFLLLLLGYINIVTTIVHRQELMNISPGCRHFLRIIVFVISFMLFITHSVDGVHQYVWFEIELLFFKIPGSMQIRNEIFEHTTFPFFRVISFRVEVMLLQFSDNLRNFARKSFLFILCSFLAESHSVGSLLPCYDRSRSSVS